MRLMVGMAGGFGPEDTILQRPPFGGGADLSLEEITEAFEACFVLLETLPSPMQWTLAGLSKSSGWSADSTLAAALAAIAEKVDDGVLSSSLPYHNRVHFCEVTLGAHFLGRALGLTPEQHTELVVAAAIHDLGHDGGSNEGEPFRMERRSLVHARPYLTRTGMPEKSLERLEALLLATDIVNGLPRARAWFRYHASQGPKPSGPEPDPAFGLMVRAPDLARSAVLLTEADALSSAGLTAARAALQEERLAAERGWTPGPCDKLRYLDAVFPKGFLLAEQFNPNLEKLRRCAASA
jgi:hypothetical protein